MCTPKRIMLYSSKLENAGEMSQLRVDTQTHHDTSRQGSLRETHGNEKYAQDTDGLLRFNIHGQDGHFEQLR